MENFLMGIKMLEAIWSYGLNNFGYIITSSIGLLLLQNIVEIGVWSQALLAEKIPALHKYKIQKDKVRNNSEIIKCAKTVIRDQLLIYIPLAIFSSNMINVLGLTINDPFPSLVTIGSMVLFCFMIDDAWQFWNHYMYHTPFLYRHIHKQHHEFKTPFAIVSNYLHPIELFTNAIGTFLGPLLIMKIYGEMHLFTFYLWLTIRMIMNTEIHLGYQFPWNLTSLIPGHGGIQYHDFHHKNFEGNYSPGLIFWDYLCKTRHPKYQPRDFKQS